MSEVTKIGYCLRAGTAVLLLLTMPVFGIQLDDLQWKNRPLLIFAPNHKHPELQKIRFALEPRSCDIDDRDMIIGVFVAQGQSRLNGRTISASEIEEIRHRLGIKPEQFAVLLIGKDGGEKFRSYNAPDLDVVFALIDRMPMRQDEMLVNPESCNPPSQS